MNELILKSETIENIRVVFSQQFSEWLTDKYTKDEFLKLCYNLKKSNTIELNQKKFIGILIKFVSFL